jgi:glycine/D-amino acid oxidase-like deaminating enzyme
MHSKKVGVLGAGFQGTCVALELASRGIEVDLFDVEHAPVTQAGYVNEGKIHLGLVYANEPSARTAATMIRGALSFNRHLTRWLAGADLGALLSSPFFYVVHRGSMVDLDRIRSHYHRVSAIVEQLGGGDYLGHVVGFVSRELHRRDWSTLFDDERVEAVFQTEERAIDPIGVALLMRDAIAASPRIRFRGGVRVIGVAENRRGVAVHVAGSRQAEVYDHVVNCLWADRIAVDETIGLTPPRQWIYRFKYGIRIRSMDRGQTVPSSTVVLGRYGDVVQYLGGEVYLSWYPVCLAGSSLAKTPPNWPREPDAERSASIARGSVAALSALCPSLRPLTQLDPVKMRVRGGIIFAWGSSDIDHRESLLHERHEIGPVSHGRYHSVDTGKYTCAPLFAVDVADRITGTTRTPPTP